MTYQTAHSQGYALGFQFSESLGASLAPRVCSVTFVYPVWWWDAGDGAYWHPGIVISSALTTTMQLKKIGLYIERPLGLRCFHLETSIYQ